MNPDQLLIRSYTMKELAGLYCCNVKTFRKWVRHFRPELGPRIGHFYNPRQVAIIFEQLGVPDP